jgi:predicted CoA-binding protein
MVGLSANHMRPSHFAAIYLANRGYDIVPVNPRAERILGRRCFPNLRAIEGSVDVVDIFRPARFVPAIVEEAIEVGAKVVWMQFGVIHEGAARRALDAGLEVVMDQCMKVEHARFFGGLSALGLNGGVVSARGWRISDGQRGL